MDYLEMKIKPTFRSKGFDGRVKTLLESGMNKAEAERICEAEIFEEMNAEAVTVYQASEINGSSVTLVGYFDIDGNPYTLPRSYESEVITDEPLRLQWMR